MFIMNFKEIHSNTEFLSTYRRARVCSCRNKIKSTFIEKWLEHYVQATFGTFSLLLGGSTNVQHPLAKYEIYLAFSKSLSLYKFNFYLHIRCEFIALLLGFVNHVAEN